MAALNCASVSTHSSSSIISTRRQPMTAQSIVNIFKNVRNFKVINASNASTQKAFFNCNAAF